MLPVLRQHVKDNLKIKSNKGMVYYSLRKTISKEKLRLTLLTEDQKITDLVLNADSIYLKLFVIKLWLQIFIRKQLSFLTNIFNLIKI